TCCDPGRSRPARQAQRSPAPDQTTDASAQPHAGRAQRRKDGRRNGRPWARAQRSCPARRSAP
nr:hypothetical protein [Tanacetum cinerariifolium]